MYHCSPVVLYKVHLEQLWHTTDRLTTRPQNNYFLGSNQSELRVLCTRPLVHIRQHQ